MDWPQEILTWERSAHATHLRASAALRRAETVEPQVWGTVRVFPGSTVIEERGATITTATQHRNSDTFWTDGLPLDKRVEAAVVWQLLSGCVARRYHPGSNKEVFDAEVFPIYQTFRVIDRRQESGRHCTLFVDSSAAIERV